MRNNGLRPRAIGALSVVAGSLFLLLCLANYGHSGFEVAGDAPLHLAIAGWFVEVFGAGAFALVLLPLVWGLVVYFREDTPSLSMRAAGTLLLACAISMISGLVQQSAAPEMTWAGAVGEYTVALTQGLSNVLGVGFALALAWAAAVTLFMASMVWATDWWFHSLRKGPWVPVLPERPRIEIEPVHVELRDEEDDAPQEREFVAMETAGAEAASALATEPADISSPVPPHEVPEGFSVHHSDDRMVVQGPVGYRGVEFLPPSEELAQPEPPVQHFVERVEMVEERFLDDEIGLPETVLGSDAVEDTDEQVAPIATVEETLGGPIFDNEPETPWDVVVADTARAVAADESSEVEQPAAAALEAPVEAAIESVAEDVGERPRSGIGLPDDSPFVDEFFAVDVLVADSVASGFSGVEMEGAGDGASADGEIEAAFGTSIPSGLTAEDTRSVEPVVDGSAHNEDDVPETPNEPLLPFGRGEPVVVDELLFADAYTIIDDEIPAPIAARSAAPTASPVVEQPAPETASADDNAHALDRIHEMQLDPLFHEAVDVVLEAGRGSAMSLQRRFGIGHGRGLRLLQQMEETGILAAEDDAGTRIALVDRATWDAFTGSRTA